MYELASVVDSCLNRLNCEWSDFVDIRIRKIHDTYLEKESDDDKSQAFLKFIEKLQSYEKAKINREIAKL